MSPTADDGPGLAAVARLLLLAALLSLLVGLPLYAVIYAVIQHLVALFFVLAGLPGNDAGFGFLVDLGAASAA